MRRDDPLAKRLLAWGWTWDAKLERELIPASIPCTLGHDSVGASVPGHRVLMAPYDWLPADVASTHRAIETLNLHHRAVVWAHYVTGHTPLKARLERLGEISSSVYYQRLDYAHRQIRRALNAQHMEVFHMESTTRMA